MTTFDEFFADHYDEVVRTLALAVGDRSRAEDAAQEAFAKAFRRWASVSRMERPLGWVIVVGMNQMRRWLVRVDKRDADHRRAQAAAPDPTAGGADDPAERIANGTTLRPALDRLPPRQRATVVLRYLCDLSTDECATALGCSPGTVKSALSAALANLRVELADADDLERTTTAPRKEVTRDAPR